MPFDKQSQRRIARTVIKNEKQGKTFGIKNDLFLPVNSNNRLLTRFVEATADIEHNDFGTADILKASDFDSSKTADSTTQFSVYNPGPKVWQGSTLLIMPLQMGDTAHNKYGIVQAWSATRIRATAPAGGITAGGSGTLSSIVPLHGNFIHATTTAHLLTSSVDVGASEEVWAELVYLSSTGASRWEIYAADCS